MAYTYYEAVAEKISEKDFHVFKKAMIGIRDRVAALHINGSIISILMNDNSELLFDISSNAINFKYCCEGKSCNNKYKLSPTRRFAEADDNLNIALLSEILNEIEEVKDVTVLPYKENSKFKNEIWCYGAGRWIRFKYESEGESVFEIGEPGV